MTFSLNETSIVDAFKSDETISEKSKEISNDIINEKYSIGNFVENLGFALTSPTVEFRVNGTKLLSNTIIHLPSDYLNEQQLKFIVAFYCDRLKDHHNVIPPVLDGILALSKMKNLPKGSSEKLFRNFIQNTTCQSQVREDRHKIYLILESMTEHCYEELKQMQADFIYGVINSIEGERDPRNLLFLFKFIPKFIEKFPLYHLSEEMFETFACYFPIDFQSSKTDDPDAITREELADKLANCLIASDDFVEWTITLLIEKLGSDLIAAKIDSLHLLRRSANKFPPKKLELHFDIIWSSLKPEIFPGSDNRDVINAGLEALKAILVNAHQQLEISRNLQTTVLSSILMHLSDAHHRLFEPASSIGLICVYADPLFAAEKILNALLIKLHNRSEKNAVDDVEDDIKEDFSDTETIVEQNTKIFNLIAQILFLCNEKNVVAELNSELCKEIEIECIKFLQMSNFIEEEFLKALLNCSSEAIRIFSTETRKIFYKFLQEILINEKYEIIDLKRILKKIYQQQHLNSEFKQYFIDEILNEFKKFPRHTKEKIYLNFSILIKTNEFNDVILSLIIENCFENQSIVEQKIALNALEQILIEENTKDTIIIEKLYRNYDFLEKSINLARNHNESYDILSMISSILCLFIKQLKIDEQKLILDKYLPKMNLSRASDLFLTKGILGYMHETVNTDQHFDGLSQDLIKLSLTNDDEILRKACHHLLCSLWNKTENSDRNRGILRKCIEILRDEIKKENKKAVEILSWISKGLLVQGHCDAAELIELLAELLEHPTLSSASSLAFEIISLDFPELHLPVVRFLFKQKFFHIVLNKIWNKLNAYSENHLNAFVYVLKMTPHRVLKMNLEKIGPILFKCLEIEKTSTVQITLEISKNFLNEQDEYFRGHLNHLIPQLLKLIKNQYSMKIRISSIECLEVLTKYPTFILLPYKYDVQYGLIPALDDKKRLVRNAAVKTRNVWFLIG